MYVDRERCADVVGHIRLCLRSGRHHRGTLREDSASGRTQEPLPALDDAGRRRYTVVDRPAHVVRPLAHQHQVRRRHMQKSGRLHTATIHV